MAWFVASSVFFGFGAVRSSRNQLNSFPPLPSKEWLASKCAETGWKHQTSPLVWRELGEGNPNGSYVGGAAEFIALVGGWVSRVSAGPPEFLFANPSFQPPMLLDGGVVQIIY